MKPPRPLPRRPRVIAAGPQSPVPRVVASRRKWPWRWLLVAALLGGSAFWFVRSGGVARFTPANTPRKPAAPVATTTAEPKPSEIAGTPEPTPAAETPQVPRANVQERIEVVRAITATDAVVASGDFSGAARALESWLAAHPGHSGKADVEREIARLQAAGKSLSDLVVHSLGLLGAPVPVGNSLWPVSGVANGRLQFRVQAQFGTVERSLEVSALGDPARVLLLQRADAARKTALAPIYLLGRRDAESARASLRDDMPDAAQLRASAEEVAALALDATVLESLDHVDSLLAQRQFASAQAAIDGLTTTHRAHPFLTAYAARLDDWRKQIASAPPPAMPEPTTPTAPPSDGYPGLTTLTLSTATKAGDPDAQKLAFGAQWAAATGNWQRHFDALKLAIGAAAARGSWSQLAHNLDQLITLPTPTLAVEQAKFIRAVGVPTLTEFAKDEDSREFLTWLFARPQVLSAFNETIEPDDKPANALMQWRTIWVDDEESRDSLANLAIACALVFDVPVKISPNVFGFEQSSRSNESRSAGTQTEAAALPRFRFYRDSAKKGSLRVALPEMTPWELVWVVDAPVPDSELVWAQKHVNFSRRDWSKAYGHIRYRMDRATQGVNPYKAYTLAEIEKEGGICGDQAYFATMTAKANGIPAMIIGGEGDRGGHAWFGYGIARNEWNLNTGRYADNYAAGTTRDPQTGRTVKEHELRQRTDPARRTQGYARSEKLVSLASLLDAVGRRELATLAYENALRAAPKNYAAWIARLDNLAASKAPAADWLRESARMRATFSKFSDLVQEIDKRQAVYVAATGDLEGARKLVHREAARMDRRDSERTDLILDAVFREADLAEKSGNADTIGRVYRDALKTKGDEVVAFRKIANRYYAWAKANNSGGEVTRELVSFFDRKHDEPTGDVFAMGAYRNVLKQLIGMTKDQGLGELQRRLERREEKMKELEEKLGKLQSRGADR